MFKKELWEWFLVHGANLEANRYMFLFLPTHLSFCFIWPCEFDSMESE